MVSDNESSTETTTTRVKTKQSRVLRSKNGGKAKNLTKRCKSIEITVAVTPRDEIMMHELDITHERNPRMLRKPTSESLIGRFIQSN